jgi:hypothetical protein
MSAVDEVTGDKTKQGRHEAIAQGGRNEMTTGQFEKRGTTDKAL